MQTHWLDLAMFSPYGRWLDPLLVDQAMAEPEPAPSSRSETATGRFNPSKHVAFTAVNQWARTDVLSWYWNLRRNGNDPGTADRIARRADQDTLDMLDYLIGTVPARTTVSKAPCGGYDLASVLKPGASRASRPCTAPMRRVVLNSTSYLSTKGASKISMVSGEWTVCFAFRDPGRRPV